jgi:hypothetical protein
MRKHFFDTWQYHQMEAFIKKHELSEGDWENLDERDDYWEFLYDRIAEDRRKVKVINYDGQENPCGHNWAAYLINKSTEWDGCFLGFFRTKKKAKKFCKKKKFKT